MRRSRWKVFLVGLAGPLSLALAATAQEGDTTTCEERCYDAEERCYETCGDVDDPDACEQRCEDRAEACLDKCEAE